MTSPGRALPRRRRVGVLALAAILLLTGTALAPVTTAAAAPAGRTTFTLAVVPDTQQEVLTPGDTRFANRAQWLVDNRRALNLAYVTHTGDVVNWDTDDHVQYERTEAGVAILDASGIPWTFSIGNHDTLATGPGGSARPGGNPSVDLRVTDTFNSYYGVDHADRLGGTFEPGRIDNSWSVFTAASSRWLVLNLELWPRTEVVSWARTVVRTHPRFNVAIVTHAMLNDDGSVQQDNGGYGANSPQYVLDRLALAYPNVRFVFSGHAGLFGLQQLTGVNGNPVSVIQTTYHSNETNPVRLVTVDVAGNSYSSSVYAPATDQTFTDGSANSRTGMNWVR